MGRRGKTPQLQPDHGDVLSPERKYGAPGPVRLVQLDRSGITERDFAHQSSRGRKKDIGRNTSSSLPAVGTGCNRRDRIQLGVLALLLFAPVECLIYSIDRN